MKCNKICLNIIGYLITIFLILGTILSETKPEVVDSFKSSIENTSIYQNHSGEIETFALIEYNRIFEADKYSVKVDLPILENKEVFGKIKTYVLEKGRNFLKCTYKVELADDEKLEFVVRHSEIDYDNIRAVYIIIFSSVDGKSISSEYRSYYYDKNTNEEVNLNYFLDTEESLEKLSEISLTYLEKYFKDNKKSIAYDEAKRITMPDINNFSNFVFCEEGLQLIFDSNQVEKLADDSIAITIPYKNLKGIIKSDYIKKYIKEEEKNEIITQAKRDLNQFNGKKLIAFTFDDGPSNATTNKLLDSLDKYNARVTFFVLGSRVKQYENSLKRAYSMGNQIGSHTYNHLNLLKLKDDEILKEVQNTNEAIEKIIGVKPTIMRPPYGNVNSNIRNISQMKTILWDVDPLDWKYRNAKNVYEEIMKTAHDGAIILLHDIYNTSIDGALMAMEELQKKGYAFVTIDEMCELKNITMNKTRSYYNFKQK